MLSNICFNQSVSVEYSIPFYGSIDECVGFSIEVEKNSMQESKNLCDNIINIFKWLILKDLLRFHIFLRVY